MSRGGGGRKEEKEYEEKRGIGNGERNGSSGEIEISSVLFVFSCGFTVNGKAG